MSEASETTPANGAVIHTGSLSRRMMLIAAGWISVLLLGGGIALDQTLTGLVTRNFDAQLSYMLNGMMASAEVGLDGEVFLNRPLGDQRLLEPNSGLYWQIRGDGHEDFPSRSLWDRSLNVQKGHFDKDVHTYDSYQFPGETLRVMERSVTLPGSDTVWWSSVAERRANLDVQIARVRRILFRSFAVLGLGLLVMAALQTWYGLGPLRRRFRVALSLVSVRDQDDALLHAPSHLPVSLGTEGKAVQKQGKIPRVHDAPVSAEAPAAPGRSRRWPGRR